MSAENNSPDNRKINDLIIRKPPGRFACPLSVKGSTIYESRLESPASKKQSLQTRASEKRDGVALSSTSRDWLKPGLSIPKFRSRIDDGFKKVEEPTLKEKHHEINEKLSTDLYIEDFVKNRINSVSEKIAEPSTEKIPSIDLFYPDLKLVNERKVDEGISECPSTIHLYSSKFSFELDVSEKLADDESSALKNWESWMKRRKQQHEHLCQKTKRKPTALVMNKAENFREVMEDRALFQYSQIPEPDKWRGPPSFWNEGDRLGHKGMIQEYLRIETAAEKGFPPEMEFVRVPDVIKAEKQLLENREIKKDRKWECSQYRNKRSEELINQRKKYRPHKVEGNDLAVVGKKITAAEEMQKSKTKELFEYYPVDKISSKPSAVIPSIVVTEEERKESLDQTTAGNLPCCYPRVDIDRKSTVCFAINDTELKCVYHPSSSQLRMANSNVNEWPLIFETKPVKTFGSASLKVENRGTMVIQYSWKMKKPKIDSNKYPNSNILDHSPWFYFDKNPGIFLPGQKYNLNFYHYSSTPGLHVENWILETVPILFNPPVQIEVILIAVSDQSYTINDWLAVESYVEKCAEETLIKQILDEILERAMVPDEKRIDYRSFFLEEELFKYQNPRHHYHSKIIDELKMIYSEIPINPSQEWDLSLCSLRKLVEEKMEDARKNSALCKISELSKGLLKPSHSTNKSDGKWHLVYSSLCKVASLIEEEVFYLESCLPSSLPNFDEMLMKSERLHSESKKTVTELEEIRSKRETKNQNVPKSAHYQHCFYIKAYHHLCDAVEQIVTIIESCKIFENRGEIPLNIEEQ